MHLIVLNLSCDCGFYKRFVDYFGMPENILNAL